MSEKDDKEFAFIKEKIKDKPINKKRLLIKGLLNICFAVVFGVVACLTFTLLQPVVEDWQAQSNQKPVSIPKDEVAAETETITETETEQDTEPAAPDTEQPLNILPSDYQRLQTQIYAIGARVNRSVVTVTGVTSDMDWFNTPYERQGQASGVIVADTGQELLILTEKKVIADAQSIKVGFINGSTADASLMKYDGNTGIAILSVARTAVDETTLSRIEVAVLGNSLQIPQGSVVIALGSQLGTNFSILTGNIISTDNVISTYDANYNVVTTDIAGNSSGSGVLINLNGDIIGLVMQDYASSSGQNTLTALSISQLKSIIEKLSNNQDIPYLGLKISTVTNDIAASYELPKGVYVKAVSIDSPALAAGLQSGDIITEIAGEEIQTVQAYENLLFGLTPGTEITIAFKRQSIEGYTKMESKATIGILK